MQKIACDIGYGFTKYKTDKMVASFPSAIAHARKHQADIALNLAHEFEGGRYLLGDAAVRNALTTRDYSWLAKYAPLLLFEAINQAAFNPADEIQLVTGLSLLNWSKRNEFAERLSDFVVDKIRVKNIKTTLVPQGKGVYLDCLARVAGLANQLCLIVDIGTNTLDVIPFESGKALAAEAYATCDGMNQVIQEVQKLVNREFGISVSEAEVTKIIRTNQISIAGETRDLSVWIEEEKQIYFEMVINQIRSKNADLFKRADVIIFAGGGANYAPDYLPESKQYYFVPEPENSNVNGYFTLLGD